MDNLEKHITINNLLDHYHPLLTEKQKTIMTYYFVDNYTLQEIADLQAITRNAVHDHIRKTIDKLYDLENKMKLMHKNEQRRTLVEKIRNHTDDTKIATLLNALEKVE